MTYEELFGQIVAKRSFLCVGLDTDTRKLPAHLRGSDNAVFEFNRAVIDSTAPFTVAYKPNLAFYEAEGPDGWRAFEQTVRYIRANYPEMFIIADAKRGDIGNTSKMYARTFFETVDVDSVTLSPYMGLDTVAPFLEYPERWATILALTSNASASDFETLETVSGERLYETVLRKSQQWGTADNIIYVVGATRADMLASIRRIVPDHFLLVPGVGAQGGSLEEVARYGMNGKCGILVNSSRAIIYADSTERFAEAAARAAKDMRDQMSVLLDRYLG